MLFYHYSKAKYATLKTSRLTHHLSPEAIKKDVADQALYGMPGGYYDHISLFIEPIPEKDIARIFEHKHEFWKSGQKLYMHIVDTADMPHDMVFEVVETPEMDEWSDRFDWYHMTRQQREMALRAFYKEMRARGFIGTGPGAMESKCKKYLGKTKWFYEQARQRDDAEETLRQYAANVPHVMVYPPNGELRVKDVGIVVLS
ncbi:hypothetical protein AVU38_gp148 [Ralstonia phage RSL2]|uniref:hypothetical protein n=1 Tax=Ralstonia phage RSL2 TaxID=1585840 RepID=UPI00054A7A15|nr:hypothetical protein AVU38_gp148 [Ralstonia phage RSL2]